MIVDTFFNISQYFGVLKAHFLIKIFLMKKKKPFSKKTNAIASRSSHKKCSIKRMFCKIHKKTPVQESLFLITLEALAYNVNKIDRRPCNRYYSVNFAKFSRTPFLKNNSAQPAS